MMSPPLLLVLAGILLGRLALAWLVGGTLARILRGLAIATLARWEILRRAVFVTHSLILSLVSTVDRFHGGGSTRGSPALAYHHH
jgi:hypothetical protein